MVVLSPHGMGQVSTKCVCRLTNLGGPSAIRRLMADTPWYRNLDLLTDLLSTVDDDVLAHLVLVQRVTLQLGTKEVLRRMRTDPQRFERFRHSLCMAVAESPAVNVAALKVFFVKVKSHMWMYAIPSSHLEVMQRNDMLDAACISEGFRKDIYGKEMKNLVKRMPLKLLYKVWLPLFTGYRVDMDTEEELMKDPSVLRALTLRVMHKYREELIVNEKFVRKCFEHRLVSVILQLVRQQEFFTVDTRCRDLTELCILVACDVGNIEVFSQLTDVIEPRHIAYAVRFSTYEFLLSVHHLRDKIRDFNDTVRCIADSKSFQNFKERRFLDWCVNHP